MEDRRTTWTRLRSSLLEQQDAFVERAVHTVRALPGVDRAPAQDMRDQLAAYFPHLLAWLTADTPIPADVVATINEASVERVRQGVPLASRLRAFQVIAHEFLRAAAEAATREHVPPADLATLNERILGALVELASDQSEVYRQVELERATADAERRAAFVRSLLGGVIETAELEERAAPYGLTIDRAYIPFRAKALTDQDHRTVVRAAVVAALVDGTTAGLAIRTTDLADAGIAVGVGPPVLLHAVAPSFALATRCLTTASALGLRGVFGLEDLGVLAAVVADRDVGKDLVLRYVAPIERLGDFGPVVTETVRTYIEGGLRLKATARVLNIHANTVRYRLSKFESLTGCSLETMNDVIGVWWALQRSAMTT